jgi:hypothetical protein
MRELRPSCPRLPKGQDVIRSSLCLGPKVAPQIPKGSIVSAIRRTWVLGGVGSRREARGEKGEDSL